MSKHWVERIIKFDEQDVTLTPGDGDGEIEIELTELSGKTEFTLFLTFEEARELARQIINYCEMEEQK